MITVDMHTERIGSNPGGKCTIQTKGKTIEAYLKYAEQSLLPHYHPFSPQHQPMYESLTFVLAKLFGLRVVPHYVLENDLSSIGIVHDHDIPRRHHLDVQRPYYFISELVSVPAHEDMNVLTDLMKYEKLYRDLLMIGDVSGRKQNFSLVEDRGFQEVLYIDLGCSFVDAHEGKISQRNQVSRLLRNPRTGSRHSSKIALRRTIQHLYETYIQTNHYGDEQDIVSLGAVCDSIPNLSIPIFPYGFKPVSALLGESEIIEIQNLLRLNFDDIIHYYKRNQELNGYKLIIMD